MRRGVFITVILLVMFSGNLLNSEESLIEWLNRKVSKGTCFDRDLEGIGDLNKFKEIIVSFDILVEGISKVKGIKMVNINISSSSALKGGYGGHKAFDNNLKTAWVEGVKGFGFREWIKFDVEFIIDYKIDAFRDGVMFNKILIFPGFGKSDKLFYANNRVKSLLLVITSISKQMMSYEEYCISFTLPGGNDPYSMDAYKNYKDTDKGILRCTDAYRLKFEDVNKYHLFYIDNPMLIGEEFEIYLFIEDVYKGSKFDDTCISEIKFLH